MAAQNWDWVFHTLGWTMAGLGLLVALWALFWDRSRGRKRCPKCWYSMEGAVEGDGGAVRCPECGRRIARERALHRTRRRMKWAVLGVSVCAVGYAVFVTPAVRRDGWVAATPTSVLVLLASPERLKEIAFYTTYNPYVPFDYPIENELVRRGEERSIYNWQADLLAWRLGNARSDAPVDSVFKSYDITTMLSPEWWSSPIPFTSDDKVELSWRILDLFTMSVHFDMWIFNGGNDGGLFRVGNRLFVWAHRTDHETFGLVHALFTTKGQGDVVSVRVLDWYGDNGDETTIHEIRMYDVTDIAPPSVRRTEEQTPDPTTDTQWGDSTGSLILENRASWDLIDDIIQNVKMDAWFDNGGSEASIIDLQGWLIIQASPEMHDLVAERIELHRTGKIGNEGGPP